MRDAIALERDDVITHEEDEAIALEGDEVVAHEEVRSDRTRGGPTRSHRGDCSVRVAPHETVCSLERSRVASRGLRRETRGVSRGNVREASMGRRKTARPEFCVGRIV